MFKIKKVFFRNGDSTIEGQNYGSYPRHEFKYLRSIKEFSTPGVSYPLLIRSCGSDYWHKNCWRKRTNSDVFAVEYVQKGTFIFRQGGQTVRVNPGEIFLVQQGTNNYSILSLRRPSDLRRLHSLRGNGVGDGLHRRYLRAFSQAVSSLGRLLR